LRSGRLIKRFMSIADIRREYNLTGLRRSNLEADPIAQFKKWFDQASGARASGRIRKLCIKLYKRLLMASGAEVMDLTAMTLATADKQGRPSARVVLLKAWTSGDSSSIRITTAAKGRSWPRTSKRRWSFIGRNRSGRFASPGKSASCRRRNPTRISIRGPEAAALRRGLRNKAPSCATGRPSKSCGRSQRLNTRATKSPAPFWGGYLLSPARMEFWQGRPKPAPRSLPLCPQQDKTWLIERLSP